MFAAISQSKLVILDPLMLRIAVKSRQIRANWVTQKALDSKDPHEMYLCLLQHGFGKDKAVPSSHYVRSFPSMSEVRSQKWKGFENTEIMTNDNSMQHYILKSNVREVQCQEIAEDH